MSETHLILASGSPRRKELLTEHGYSFEVIPPDDSAECGICSGESPEQMVQRLARQKTEDVAKRFQDGLYLGADTIACCHGQILGKPENEEHARQMLTLMRGQQHQVVSGVCLWERPSDTIHIAYDVTTLVMDDISDSDLESYLETDQWIGKAGAFGYQDGLDWVHIVEGSESNVVGLPMELLAKMLSARN